VASLPRPGLTLSDAGASLSVFALARASPERHLFVDDRRALQRIALDMENTVLAEALPTRVFAGFQKWSFVLPVVHRYARLARIARGVWVFGLPDIDPPAIAASRRRDYRAQLTRVDATVSRLLARLSVILTRTDLLAKLGAPSPEQLPRSVVAIRAEARRLDEMLLSLVDVARIEAGRLQLARTDLDVQGLVDGVAETYRALAQAQEKAIAVGVEVPAGTVVSAERDKLVRGRPRRVARGA
jgi:signal transduction histidine kinase